MGRYRPAPRPHRKPGPKPRFGAKRYCPRCIGHAVVTCDACWGFSDQHSPCQRCGTTGHLPCPECRAPGTWVEVFAP
ncbi:hypothetical protein TG1_49 [Streptomyces phage TG1]|uniref:Uncharacterized protein n=1 Tax=Streptomyces phage TG1 TaxID=2927987 RepID=K4IBR4_9CAUD|nr:hypothetical protein D281_gp50 [Streptomyces phage TG1]AFU62244.1 hypothetical protein TG1_49 [Streptomyces phage TG1]